MGWIRKTLGALALSVALVGCGNKASSNCEASKRMEEKSMMKTELEDCESRLAESIYIANKYGDKGLYKELTWNEGEDRFCSPRGYKVRDDLMGIYNLTEEYSLKFCKENYTLALAEAVKSGDVGTTMMLERMQQLGQKCYSNPKTLRTRESPSQIYRAGASYRQYARQKSSEKE